MLIETANLIFLQMISNFEYFYAVAKCEAPVPNLIFYFITHAHLAKSSLKNFKDRYYRYLYISQLQMCNLISVPFHLISVSTGVSIHIERLPLPIKSETITGKTDLPERLNLPSWKWCTNSTYIYIIQRQQNGHKFVKPEYFGMNNLWHVIMAEKNMTVVKAPGHISPNVSKEIKSYIYRSTEVKSNIYS